MQGRRRGGVRRMRGGWQAYVRLHAGVGGLRTKQYSIDAVRRDMQAWIDETFLNYRRKHPRGAKGTLAGDVVTYLATLVNRPALQAERTFQLAWWCERFGHRARHTLTSVELKTALNELLAQKYAASTVRHYRTALFHLFTELDGKNASNPLRDVAPAKQPDPLPRHIPYEIIEAIFEAMPDRRHGRKLTNDQATTIRAQVRRRGANVSAVARAFGISETMVRKIRDGRWKDKADLLSKTKARLRVMAYTAIPPAQIKQLQPADVTWDDPSVLVRGRKKGGGVRPTRLPLIPEGVTALRALEAADAWGPYSTSSALQSFRGGIDAMCTALEEDPATKDAGEQLRRQLAHATPYALRHSFLTEAQLATGDIRTTQAFAMHSDIRQTQRYTLAAVDPALKAAAALLATRRAEQAARNIRATNDGQEGLTRADFGRLSDRGVSPAMAAKRGANRAVSSRK